MNLFLCITTVVVGTMLIAMPVQASQQSCPTGYSRTTPDSDFADAGNGTVRHIPTGLIWKRCAEGQTWDGSTCTGVADTYTWQQPSQRAVAVNAGTQGWNAGQSDWRVPNQKELRSIVERSCVSPSINLTQFPATPGASYFWSNSPYVRFSNSAWLVDFNLGAPGPGLLTGSFQLRLVRAGQYPQNFDAAITRKILRLVPYDTSMRVYFYADNVTGIVRYTAKCVGSSGTHQQDGTTSPIVVTNLTKGVSYTCSVRAYNSAGSSAESATMVKVAKRIAGIAPMLGIILE